MTAHPVGEGPGDVFQVVVLQEVGGVEADPRPDAGDDDGADVRCNVPESVRGDGLEEASHHALQLLHLPVACAQRALKSRHPIRARLHTT